jgi:hypothetical protein
MTTAEVKNSIRSGPYRIDLRDVQKPYDWEVKGPLPPVMKLKLDFHPPKDIGEYMEIPPETKSRTSQMYLTIDEHDLPYIIAYIKARKLEEIPIVKELVEDILMVPLKELGWE